MSNQTNCPFCGAEYLYGAGIGMPTYAQEVAHDSLIAKDKAESTNKKLRDLLERAIKIAGLVWDSQEINEYGKIQAEFELLK